MAVKIDMPATSAAGQNAQLLDASASFSIVVKQGGGFRWSERYAQKKESFVPTPIGTESTIRPNYFLINETNFTDAGGGFFTFDRVYANVPSSWSETQQMSFNYIAQSILIVGGVSEIFETSRSAQVSTKVTHTYQVGYPDTAAATSLKDPKYLGGSTVSAGTTVRPQEVNRYLGNIYEILTYETLKDFSA